MLRLPSKIVYLALCLSCTAERPETDSSGKLSENAVLEEFLASYYDDMSARDWEKYRSYFWDNATITTPWQKPGDSAVRVHVITIDEFIRETPQGPDSQPVFREQMKTSSIDVRNNMATAWVQYDAEFGRPDSLMTWSGTDLFSLLKNDGQWKIASLVFQSN